MDLILAWVDAGVWEEDGEVAIPWLVMSAMSDSVPIPRGDLGDAYSMLNSILAVAWSLAFSTSANGSMDLAQR